jgi:hypothetical protein
VAGQGKERTESFERERSGGMTTLKHIDDRVIDATGPYRKIRLPDGLYIVGQEMLIAADSEEEADRVLAELREYAER